MSFEKNSSVVVRPSECLLLPRTERELCSSHLAQICGMYLPEPVDRLSGWPLSARRRCGNWGMLRAHIVLVTRGPMM